MLESVELGVTSSFSFLRGASNPEALATRAAQLDIGTLALTDYNGLYGVPRFYQATKRLGIRTIVGTKLVVASIGTLRLLCENHLGYQNLCRLLTLGHARSSKGNCVLSPEDLSPLAKGILCLYGAPPCEISIEAAQTLKQAFSTTNLFIEIHHHLDQEVESRTERLVHLAEACQIPIVASNNVHHGTAKEKKLLDVLHCIRKRQSLDHAGRQLFPNAERRLKSAKQWHPLFAKYPQAIRNGVLIAQRCEFDFRHLGYQFPLYPTPDGQTSNEYLATLVYAGAANRYRTVNSKIKKQLSRELALIKKLRLAGYFLIVWDICRFARDNNILCQGRGSAANSVTCYVLGITAVDPIELNLLFERFLSEERGEWPDIDIDFPSGSKRESVIQYVYKKYGPHGAAMTANVITFRDRSALRESGLALGFSHEQVDLVAKEGGRWSDIEDTQALTQRFVQAGISPKNHRPQLWIEMAQTLLHHPRHLGQHSGGMVIAAGRLDQIVPIEPATMANRRVIQWDKDDCASVGMIKVDLLGLGMLSALEKAVPLIAQTERKHIDYAHLPPNDPNVYDMLCRADTVGVFQVESRAQMATLPRLKPRTFYDLVIEIALIRPGPVSGNMVHPYLKRRSGREPISYPHPSLEPILKKTLGVPIFQEQVMRMAMVAANFTGGEAEELRRAMGFKRSTMRMDALKKRLRQGMSDNQISRQSQNEIIKSITAFASYGFPESHSASFALLAYASAYLKAYHHGAFTCALLNSWPLGFYNPNTLVKDAQRHGVRVLPVDIHQSHWNCTLADSSTLRLGFRYAQGVSYSSIERVLTERARLPFSSLKNFERRCQLSNAELATLAELGAFASIRSGKSSPISRREALWETAQLKERSQGLMGLIHEPLIGSVLREMTLQERIKADYRQSGMSVGSHPIQFVRSFLQEHGAHPSNALIHLSPGVHASVAGLITVRQRPMTAKGFLFITLEDETGFSNLIISPPVFKKYRKTIITAEGLWAEGVLQVQDSVVHIKAQTLRDLNSVLANSN